jgi:hypothetical protein
VKIIQVPEEYEVEKTIMVPKVIQEEREIRIPRPVIEKKTVRVPKQRIVTEEEEVSIHVNTFLFLLEINTVWFSTQHTISVPATEEITQTVTVPRPVQTQVYSAPAPTYSTYAAPTTSYAAPSYGASYAAPTYGAYSSFGYAR